MKKVLYILLCIVSAGCFTGCKFDDPVVEYPTKAVLFTYQYYERELVVGEGLKFKPGVVFSGLDRSDRDREVSYIIDATAVPAGKTLLPEDYYTCDNASKIVIKKGQLKGYVQYTLDSAKFVSDPKALTGEYVLPFRIISADADTITAGKDSMVLSIKYLAKQFGYYTYTSKQTNTVTGEVVAQANISNETNSVRELTTLGPDLLSLSADPKNSSDPVKGLGITLQVAPIGGGAVTFTSATATAGTCSYDAATKTFTLNYSYDKAGQKIECEDVMVFRNRIRDQQPAPYSNVYINEWEGF